MMKLCESVRRATLALVSAGIVSLALNGCTIPTSTIDAAASGSLVTARAPNDDRPNVVIFYVDDLGYGDVGFNGANGVATPNVDRMARAGLQLTDAHSEAATCTPSRYSLLTGEYAFRVTASILPGDAPLLIRPERPTLPKLFKRAGYTTGIVGKWHLGLGNGEVDWNGRIAPGPLETGFDYSFILPATNDRVPTVLVEGHHVVNGDASDPISVSYKQKIGNRSTGAEHPELLRMPANPEHSGSIVNGVSRIGWMKGGEKALWVDEDLAEIFTAKSRQFMRENRNRPFFLYESVHNIHVPRLPGPEFRGKSTMGVRGDSIAEMDWMLGQILEELRDLSIERRTIVIFSSDNGPIADDGYGDQAVELLCDHKPAGPLRGSKYSAFEGGTAVPTVVYWPGTVRPGTSAAVVSQVDLYASLAALIGASLAPDEAIDSRNLLDAWTNRSPAGRDVLFEETPWTFALRRGEWKYVGPVAANFRLPSWAQDKDFEPGVSSQPQLYNLMSDPGERHDVAGDHPDIVKSLQSQLEAIVSRKASETSG